MLRAVAVCPYPPALVPELMGAAAAELDPLREACDRVVRAALADVERLVVVGPGPSTRAWDGRGTVSFRGYGVDVAVPCLDGGGPVVADLPALPLPLAVGRWLLSRALAHDGAALPAAVDWWTVDAAGAEGLGRALRESRDSTALLALGDGAASHGPKAPRAEDSRATTYDDALADALGSGLPERLAALDIALGEQVGAGGGAVWRLLAAATQGATQDETDPGPWRGAVEHRATPYGVGYVVARWQRTGD